MCNEGDVMSAMSEWYEKKTDKKIYVNMYGRTRLSNNIFQELI